MEKEFLSGIYLLISCVLLLKDEQPDHNATGEMLSKIAMMVFCQMHPPSEPPNT